MATSVELPMLGLLGEGPLHGYELKRRIESLVGFFGSVSYGSLYPMFHGLEVRGYVTHTLKQPGRIVYHITPKGRERFLKLMHELSIPLTQKLLFFQDILSTERKQILERHKEELVDRLEKYRRVQESIDVNTIDRYRAALFAREIEHVSRDMTWLQDLIYQESESLTSVNNKEPISRRSPERPRKRR
jgi:DNA-binding PadR family transcriptional regulator